jgi:Domain of unknown function (DUF4262)
MDCHRGLPDAGGSGPSFAYAVDRSGKGLQELAIYGLPGQVAHSLLNQLARRIVESGVALQTGDRIEGRPGRRCASGGGGDDRRQGSKSDARVLRRRRRRSAGGVAGLRWGAAVGRGRSEQRCRTAGAGRPPAARPVYHANRLAVTTKVLSDSSGLLVRMTRAPRACRPLAIAPPRPPEGELFA